jgi:hypothetical protein
VVLEISQKTGSLEKVKLIKCNNHDNKWKCQRGSYRNNEKCRKLLPISEDTLLKWEIPRRGKLPI